MLLYYFNSEFVVKMFPASQTLILCETCLNPNSLLKRSKVFLFTWCIWDRTKFEMSDANSVYSDRCFGRWNGKCLKISDLSNTVFYYQLTSRIRIHVITCASYIIWSAPWQFSTFQVLKVLITHAIELNIFTT